MTTTALDAQPTLFALPAQCLTASDEWYTPRQGNVFVYYGDRIMQFRQCFGEFGRVFVL